ncbi:hypothetical protein CCACVL1_24915 [Corchorus capsularis]|uniref:Uncharacterized protein n=1 Tax=Corchorus capsularis TaxID=210143 RepID=A0A1R3GMH9_COCAP|nr:hypothetical protein CCACVL1_24915 [Corchorus capsularis]
MAKYPNTREWIRVHFPRFDWKELFDTYIFSDPLIRQVCETVYNTKPDKPGVDGDERYGDDILSFARVTYRFVESAENIKTWGIIKPAAKQRLEGTGFDNLLKLTSPAKRRLNPLTALVDTYD